MAEKTKSDLKRCQRSANFTNQEEEVLLRLALRRKAIVECKISNIQTTSVKNVVWNEIAKDFNLACPDMARTALVLRNKYTNIKRQLRKNAAASDSKDWKPKSKTMAELAETIELSGEGYSTMYDDNDDDIDPMEIVTCSEVEEPDKSLESVETLDDKGTNYAGATNGDEDHCSITKKRRWTNYNYLRFKRPIRKTIGTKREANGGETVLALKKKLLRDKINSQQAEHDLRMQQITVQVELNKLLVENQRKDGDMRQTEHVMRMKILAAEYESKLNSTVVLK